MGYNRKNYARIRESYSDKYLVARGAAEDRRNEVHMAIPEVAEIDRAMGEVGLSLMGAVLGGEDPEKKIAEVRRRNQELQARRAAILVAHGYPADYTEIRYECPLCGDTGFVDCKMCKCMREKLIMAGYESSGMSNLLMTQSFDNFDLSYHENDPAAHRRMSQIFAMMKQYAETFAAGKSDNLVLFGGTGLGKTHLSSAVAKTVIERGYDVYYVSAVGLLADFEMQRFGNSAGGESGEDTSRCFECDLLIIDDLGTEVNNKFTTSVLYNLINTRLNRHAATIISTNLSQEEFRSRYWDRITSRVFGEYRVLPFMGTDVRAQKLHRRS